MSDNLFQTRICNAAGGTVERPRLRINDRIEPGRIIVAMRDKFPKFPRIKVKVIGVDSGVVVLQKVKK